MWGSASADRSLIETQDTVLRLHLHFGDDVSPLRPGMSDGGSPRPPRQRSDERWPASAGRTRPVPMPRTTSVAQSVVPREPPMPASADVDPRTGCTDLLRQAPTTCTKRTDLLRQAPTVRRIPHPLRRARGSHPAFRCVLRHAPHSGGRARGALFSINRPSTSVDGEAVNGKSLHRLR
jgi:hypothetical protein